MIWEALGSVIVGLAITLAATRRLPGRFPSRPLTLATGPAAALLGAFLAHSILGPDHFFKTLLAAAALSVAMLSLLVRPRGGLVPIREMAR
ncbi:hypothetical protein A6A06_02935 [Streptomyces sp. CB02923]|uniref:hypothetical protein n=1 Tax=Streptomyces sp. CB02923 TaxID=1718985 RepID=UPI00093ED7DC|nr:hypothetical protein [Streptomyces sp. CB02923]OKI09636.1 hypothetical protein A6A06_02935 [Streptomyces sp. CB02923]